MTYISKLVHWLQDPSNGVPRTPNAEVLEPYLRAVCDHFEITRRNKDVQLSVDFFLADIETTKPKVLRDDIHNQSNWYLDLVRTNLERPIWDRLQDFLLEKRKRSAAVVAHLNAESDIVTNAFHDPRDQEAFYHRGMVVGYVQSGKTANMAATIAKASDAGYRCIIVLAGVLDTLRQQTQFRFQQELFGYRQNVFTSQWADADHVEDDDTCRIKASTDCHADDPRMGEITAERLKALFQDYNDRDQWNTTRVFVIKKTTARIDLMTDFLGSLSRMLVQAKFNVPTLVIDDECDQATINTKSKRGDVTAINKSIRSLLVKLRRHCYVGYTATPFANLFIDPNAETPDLGEDLYPKDFIATLTPPPEYTGTKELFGIMSVADPEQDRDPLDIIISIPDSEHRSLGDKNATGPVKISADKHRSLYTAVLDFFVSSALQEARGRKNEDMTMLIHPSAYKNIQDRIHKPILALLKTFQSDRQSADLHRDLRARLEIEFHAKSEAMRNLPHLAVPERQIEYDELKELIEAIIGRTEVVLLHGSSKHVLRYGDRHNPKRYIVIGGNKLSRGLTLEGLSVSYFLRKSTTYDTLLQMGRWFGYRASYIDLTRLYMSEEMRDFFSALAFIEMDMRAKFERNYLDARTPREVPTHIAKISGLNIVAGNKMGAATMITESYSGRFLEQNRLDVQEPDKILQRNGAILKWLQSLPAPHRLMSAKTKDQPRLGAYLWHSPLSSEKLADALEPLDLGNIKKTLMLRALRNQSDSKDIANLKWYLAIGGKETGTPVTNIICGGESIPLVSVNRKLKGTPNPPRIQRLISGSEIDSIVRPRIRQLGGDPSTVGIISIYFVNSSEEVLWGDRLMNPPRPTNWNSLGIPFIAAISLIVPDAAKGTMYVGVDVSQALDDCDDMEVESDD